MEEDFSNVELDRLPEVKDKFPEESRQEEESTQRESSFLEESRFPLNYHQSQIQLSYHLSGLSQTPGPPPIHFNMNKDLSIEKNQDNHAQISHHSTESMLSLRKNDHTRVFPAAIDNSESQTQNIMPHTHRRNNDGPSNHQGGPESPPFCGPFFYENQRVLNPGKRYLFNRGRQRRSLAEIFLGKRPVQPIQLLNYEPTKPPDNYVTMEEILHHPFKVFLKGWSYKKGFPKGVPYEILTEIPKGVVLEFNVDFYNRDIRIKKHAIQVMEPPFALLSHSVLSDLLKELKIDNAVGRAFLEVIGMAPQNRDEQSWNLFEDNVIMEFAGRGFPFNFYDIERKTMEKIYGMQVKVTREKVKRGKRNAKMDQFPFVIEMGRVFYRQREGSVRYRKFMNCMEILKIQCTRIAAVLKHLSEEKRDISEKRRYDLVLQAMEPICKSLYFGCRIPSSGIKKKVEG